MAAWGLGVRWVGVAADYPTEPWACSAHLHLLPASLPRVGLRVSVLQQQRLPPHSSPLAAVHTGPDGDQLPVLATEPC